MTSSTRSRPRRTSCASRTPTIQPSTNPASVKSDEPDDLAELAEVGSERGDSGCGRRSGSRRRRRAGRSTNRTAGPSTPPCPPAAAVRGGPGVRATVAGSRGSSATGCASTWMFSSTSSRNCVACSSSKSRAYMSSLARIFLAFENICFSPVESPLSACRMARLRTTSATSKMSPVLSLSRLCL